MTWYKEGTINVTNGSANVVGVGTEFVANINLGEELVVRPGQSDELRCEIVSVNSDVSLTISPGDTGSSQSGQTYAISPVKGMLRAAAVALTNAQAAVQAHLNGALAGAFPNGSLALPGMRFASDPDTGLRRAGSNHIALVAGGEDKFRVTGNSASGSVVQSGPTDTTPGRLLKQGAFGLGEGVTLTAADDLDDLTASGMFYNPSSGNSAGNNYPISRAGSLLVIARSTTNVTQRFVSYGGNSLAGDVRMFERSYGTAGFSPWVEVMHQGRMVGNVSQSGGVPTGAVMESGNNANGEYVRFADGTQMCWAALSSSNPTSWTFPAAFSAVPVVTANVTDNHPRMCAVDAITTTGCDTYVYTDSGGLSTTGHNAMAIGRWF